MRSRINKKIAQSVRDTLAKHKKDCKVSLSFEIKKFDLNEIFELLRNYISDWEAEYFFVAKEIQSSFTIEIISHEDLDSVFSENANGDVVSIVDPKNMDGLTFDIEVKDHPYFLVSCWGSYESISEGFKQKFPEGEIFRGN